MQMCAVVFKVNCLVDSTQTECLFNEPRTMRVYKINVKTFKVLMILIHFHAANKWLKQNMLPQINMTKR